MNEQPPIETPGRSRGIPPTLRMIVKATRHRVDHLRHTRPEDRMHELPSATPKRSLMAALRQASPAIIAEVKKASPSQGIFTDPFDSLRLARAYRLGGAAALSVVTEPEFFLGELAWLPLLKRETGLPVLRKDFIIDELQVTESAAFGADAILLIARILSADELRQLKTAADRLGLDVLFEIHDLDDMQKISPLHPAMIGINARNLKDFTVNTGLFTELIPHLPQGTLAVAESGLASAEQIATLSRAGFLGFLIGERLIRADDPAATLRRLRGVE